MTGARQTELAATTRQLGPALAAGRQLLDRTAQSVPHLRTLVDRAGPLVDALGPFADQVVPATRAAAPFLDQTKKLVKGAPEQLLEQRKFITLAQPVLGKLSPLLDRLNPVADQLRVYHARDRRLLPERRRRGRQLRPQRPPDPDPDAGREHAAAEHDERHARSLRLRPGHARGAVPPDARASTSASPGTTGGTRSAIRAARHPTQRGARPDAGPARQGRRCRRSPRCSLIVIGVLYFTSRPPAGANEVTAEFDNAFPLIEGMYVRVDGAIAGSVGKITVNDRGNAEVDLELDDSIEPPTANATAAIRQQDTTGDSYVAYDPGDSEAAARPGRDRLQELRRVRPHARRPAARRPAQLVRLEPARRDQADPRRDGEGARPARRRPERSGAAAEAGASRRRTSRCEQVNSQNDGAQAAAVERRERHRPAREPQQAGSAI